MKEVKYFISYAFKQNGNIGYGNLFIDTDEENGFIENLDDIQMIEKRICESLKISDVVILNYREM